jgi:phosphoglycerate-specific signal transduction histidine kinase
MASGIPYQHELRLRRVDGEYRWFGSRGVPIRDDSWRIARWYVLLTDIEDRTRALARLDQMQLDFAHMNCVSVMGELVASLSHEITQPMPARASTPARPRISSACSRIWARSGKRFREESDLISMRGSMR